MDKKKIEHFKTISKQYSDASIIMHEAIARKAGLTGTDHKYLGLILQHSSITAGEISKLTGLTTGAVTALIDRLEKKELLRREFTKEDRRKVIVIPNIDNSMKLLQPLFDELQQKTVKLISTFSEDELQVVERYFTEATAIMKETSDHLNQK
ncbi:MarR family transcriptional regulator [Chryseobacterium sp. T16E-39]|uniref:MarR family winged helix-turn-helix transcriptional regulator n=1 Tax=Chryseobacterium sp. T16E-39 TaxID=2015076 RepID=UPI000B5B3E96|nr:MarR family transcriptional regulator [Chryseobacterium sp. T16E-39]ASK28705.1 MarR family transcriptional regulator [Chryseobacterium sp. T16E-39]